MDSYVIVSAGLTLGASDLLPILMAINLGSDVNAITRLVLGAK